jgi:hypothetical protein
MWGEGLLYEVLEKAWVDRSERTPIELGLTFCSDGLILGAGTVLIPALDQARNRSIRDAEPRALALLTAAYDRQIGPSVFDHIRCAVKRWDRGDRSLAEVHLALTGLGRLDGGRSAARRLFMADQLLAAGAEPETILRAMHLAAAAPEFARRDTDGTQPRVPAGNGRISGQWANVGKQLLHALTQNAAARLVTMAARLPPVATFLGVLFFPSKAGGAQQTIDVPGHPGLRLIRQADETHWMVVDESNGEQTVIQQKEYGVLRDAQGRVVGRVLPNGSVAVDLAAVAPSRTRPEEPRLCPLPVPDKFGQGPGSVGRAYEDLVKLTVNPEAPTPSGMGIALANPSAGGKDVVFDDCEHSTGTMIEAKGPTYTDILIKAEKSNFLTNILTGLLDQSLRQVQAAGARPLRWYFADTRAADDARLLFARRDVGREKIQVVVLPFTGSRK